MSMLSDTPDASTNAINAIFEKNFHLFTEKPVLLAKKEKISKKCTLVRVEYRLEKIYFKTKSKNVDPPYLEVSELWDGGERLEYRYGLVVPSIECVFRVDGVTKQTGTYRFRYEKHAPPHKYSDHLHIMDLPSHLESERISFSDFFSMIMSEFIRDDKFAFEGTDGFIW